MASLQVRMPAERLLAPMQPARPGPHSPGGDDEEDGAYADDFSVKSTTSSSPAKGSSAKGGGAKGVGVKGGKGKASPAPATPTARATAAPATPAAGAAPVAAAATDTPLALVAEALPTTPAPAAAASLQPIDTTPLPLVDTAAPAQQPPPSAQTDGTQDAYGEDDFEGEDSLSMRSTGPGTYSVPFSKCLPSPSSPVQSSPWAAHLSLSCPCASHDWTWPCCSFCIRCRRCGRKKRNEEGRESPGRE